MAQPYSSTKFTYEDYLLFPDDGKRHEIIDGEHYVTPSPVTKHQRILGNIFVVLGPYIKKTTRGQLFVAPMDVVLSDLDVVQPDLLYIFNARASIITDKNIQGAPDLVVEILSESSRKTDEIIKRKLYERHRIDEYWIVDPELESIKIYRHSDKGYSRRTQRRSKRHPGLSAFSRLGNSSFTSIHLAQNVLEQTDSPLLGSEIQIDSIFTTLD